MIDIKPLKEYIEPKGYEIVEIQNLANKGTQQLYRAKIKNKTLSENEPREAEFIFKDISTFKKEFLRESKIIEQKSRELNSKIRMINRKNEREIRKFKKQNDSFAKNTELKYIYSFSSAVRRLENQFAIKREGYKNFVLIEDYCEVYLNHYNEIINSQTGINRSMSLAALNKVFLNTANIELFDLIATTIKQYKSTSKKGNSDYSSPLLKSSYKISYIKLQKNFMYMMQKSMQYMLSFGTAFNKQSERNFFSKYISMPHPAVPEELNYNQLKQCLINCIKKENNISKKKKKIPLIILPSVKLAEDRLQPEFPRERVNKKTSSSNSIDSANIDSANNNSANNKSSFRADSTSDSQELTRELGESHEAEKTAASITPGLVSAVLIGLIAGFLALSNQPAIKDMLVTKMGGVILDLAVATEDDWESMDIDLSFLPFDMGDKIHNSIASMVNVDTPSESGKENLGEDSPLPGENSSSPLQNHQLENSDMDSIPQQDTENQENPAPEFLNNEENTNDELPITDNDPPHELPLLALNELLNHSDMISGFPINSQDYSPVSATNTSFNDIESIDQASASPLGSEEKPDNNEKLSNGSNKNLNINTIPKTDAFEKDKLKAFDNDFNEVKRPSVSPYHNIPTYRNGVPKVFEFFISLDKPDNSTETIPTFPEAFPLGAVDKYGQPKKNPKTGWTFQH